MRTKQSPPKPRLRRPKRRRLDFTQLLVWSLVALSVAMAALAVALALLYRSDLILPGVEALGIDLGGKSKAEAAIALRRSWGQRAIVLTADEVSTSVSPAELGIILDTEAMAQAAHRKGRLLGDIEAMLREEPRVTVAPMWEVRPTVAEASLRALASQFDVAPVDAAMRLVNGQIEVLPPVPARAIDVPASVAWLEQNTQRVLAEARLNLMVVLVQPAITDVSAVVAQASRLLANSLYISLYDPISDEASTWSITPDVWSTWLDLDTDTDDPTSFHWQLDTEKAKSGLEEQMSMLGPDRHLDLPQAVTGVREALATGSWGVRLRVYHHDGQHTVGEGETLASIAHDRGFPYPWIQQANPGVSNELYVGQVLTIPSPDVLLPLPVAQNKRITVSLSEQKIRAYENGAIRWEWPVSTGLPDTPTSPGVFQIQSHDPNAYASIWDLWMPHFMGVYRPVPAADFMNGFHGFPSRGGDQLLWTNNLGRPVTYGCIMLSTENAAELYDWAEEGVVVEIRP